MIALVWELLPLLLGIVASPLALMALIAVLLSRRARLNGAFFAVGWILAILLVTGLAYVIWDGLGLNSEKEQPVWVSVVRVVFGVFFALAAVWTYRKARVGIRALARASTPQEIVDATPQLPGVLQAVEHFSPGRSFLLGLGIFLLNPINVSCAILAVLEIKEASLAAPAPAIFLAVFVLLGIAPMVAPAMFVIAQGPRAAGALERLRTWIATHNGMISSIFLAMVAFGQLQKAFQAWA